MVWPSLRSSGLAGFAVGVAPVAFGLARGFVCDDALDPGFFSGTPFFGFSSGFRFGCRDPVLFLGLKALQLSCLDLLARGAPFFPRGRHSFAFSLFSRHQGFCGRFGGAKALKQRLFCSRSFVEAIGKVVISFIFQISGSG